MDDKRLHEQSYLMRLTRPFLKSITRQRWLSKALFRNAANPTVIKNILSKAYPSGKNIDDELIRILHSPSQRSGADEAFRGFINLFNDHLAPELMVGLETPVDLIWGANDPWEPLQLAEEWSSSFECIRSLSVIKGAGHCPHDEMPEEVNPVIQEIFQQAT